MACSSQQWSLFSKFAKFYAYLKDQVSAILQNQGNFINEVSLQIILAGITVGLRTQSAENLRKLLEVTFNISVDQLINIRWSPILFFFWTTDLQQQQQQILHS